METETVSAIHNFTLQARELLEKEVGEQLEGIYGLLPTGKWEPPEKYPALAKLPEAKETRKRLEQFLEDEKAAGVSPKEGRNKLAKETAFTWLNRLVAFKMMESRKLLRQAISKGPQSKGFLLWLTESGNEKDYEKYEQGDLPESALGEGPRQDAYRHFLLWQCGQLAQEIRVLFDPDNLASRLFPRHRALSQLIEKMNDPKMEEGWALGNEETIGWVYQFFNEDEKKEVFDRLYKKKQKIRKEDIPAATELFTPNWIVTWLIHNSLGRYWMQIHPDSKLAGQLKYLVPLAGEIPNIPLKKVEEIKLLDPASGTMQFGLVAFDLFVDMYREELEKSGFPNWPAEPSVRKVEEIASAIIANNIHGIDIDLRAVQLSAMALFLKAKSLNKSAHITVSHIACAEVVQLDDAKLAQFLTELKLTDSIYARLLKGIWIELKNLGQFGSLLRFEAKLKKLVEEEKKKFKSEQEKPHLPGFAPDQFETEAGESEFWEIIETQILQALHIFAKNQAEKGRDESFFAGEVVKGFEVLDIMTKRYDIVATNPPYMARRNMNDAIAKFLQNEYPNSKGDLYTAFIERCSELLDDNGRFAMITQQSFMFLSSYEKMRDNLISNHSIENMSHVGPHAFDAISGEKVNTTLFVLRRESDTGRRDEAVGTFFRLVKEPDAESKQTRFEVALALLNSEDGDPIVYRYRQGDFDAIPGSPWVYWIGHNLRNMFAELPKLHNSAVPASGQNTGDNFRFIRFWWEMGKEYMASSISTNEEATKSGKRWFPYMKGGSFKRWYGNQEFCLNWYNDGRELKAFCVIRNKGKHWSRYLQNLSYNFKEGITYSFLTSSVFSARISPGGFMFDYAGCSVFGQDVYFLLALLNSKLGFYFLKLINPTVNFQPGDISRLPIASSKNSNLERHVKEAIHTAMQNSRESETTFDFIAPPIWVTDNEVFKKAF